MSPVLSVDFASFRGSASFAGANYQLLSAPSADQHIIRNEELQDLYSSISKLPAVLAEVIFLHYFKELSLQQIARLQNKPLRVVQTHLKLSLYLLKIFVLKHKPAE